MVMVMRRKRNLGSQFSPAVLEMGALVVEVVRMKGMVGGQDGRGDDADIKSDGDEGEEAEESGSEAGFSGVKKL